MIAAGDVEPVVTLAFLDQADDRLITTQLIALAALRYVWKIEPVASMTEDELINWVAPNVQRYIDGDLG